LFRYATEKFPFLTLQIHQIAEQRAGPVVVEKEPRVETLG
jgi:hypothetical protein